jgi:hypothetical protein
MKQRKIKVIKNKDMDFNDIQSAWDNDNNENLFSQII